MELRLWRPEPRDVGQAEIRATPSLMSDEEVERSLNTYLGQCRLFHASRPDWTEETKVINAVLNGGTAYSRWYLALPVAHRPDNFDDLERRFMTMYAGHGTVEEARRTLLTMSLKDYPSVEEYISEFQHVVMVLGELVPDEEMKRDMFVRGLGSEYVGVARLAKQLRTLENVIGAVRAEQEFRTPGRGAAGRGTGTTGARDAIPMELDAIKGQWRDGDRRSKQFATSQIKCYRCQGFGHVAKNCGTPPDGGREGGRGQGRGDSGRPNARDQ